VVFKAAAEYNSAIQPSSIPAILSPHHFHNPPLPKFPRLISHISNTAIKQYFYPCKIYILHKLIFMLRNLLNSILKFSGYRLEKIRVKKTNAEGYPQYLEEASALNLDVNDYLDNNKGWIKPLPVLEDTFFPFIKNLNSPSILELGPGTGRWSRYIADFAKKINCREYILVDHSPWFVNFLSEYFKDNDLMKVKQNDGVSLPFFNSSFDVIFSQGVLPELKPPVIYLYAKEFSRVLKTGGICVFDYFTYDSPEGWDYFIKESEKGNLFYTYYTDELIDKIFFQEGFELIQRFTYSKSKFPVYRKI